ncbi:hypothetical protein E2P81_ATG01166 [Venturia nashicola]|nr:hypothetical protein E2P81_ATG01166 [Venturia nashicola]
MHFWVSDYAQAGRLAACGPCQVIVKFGHGRHLAGSDLSLLHDRRCVDDLLQDVQRETDSVTSGTVASSYGPSSLKPEAWSRYSALILEVLGT